MQDELFCSWACGEAVHHGGEPRGEAAACLIMMAVKQREGDEGLGSLNLL